MAYKDVFSRRVRATKDESDDEDLQFTDSELSSSQIPYTSTEEQQRSSDEGSVVESNLDDAGGTSITGAELANISFGALARAQDSLGKRRRGQDQVLTDSSSISPTRDIGNPEAAERRTSQNGRQEHTRSSKHAPAELSAKKAVSRKREVVPSVKRDIRDPRFEPTSGPPDLEKAKKNYGFLAEYRDSEISQLKSTIRQTKDPKAKDKLERALLRAESRKKTQQIKDQEQEILRIHRAKEKELIKRGKKPFYLKKGEQKKLALVQRFQGMKKGQVDNVIQRRRKKKASREKRDMPEERRLRA
ncbi:MAG: hypothetical protein Q9219_001754 [cf. Caloplaca sp. 3 TL-2023]